LKKLWRIKKPTKPRTYNGWEYTDLAEALEALYGLLSGVEMTENENKAMEIAIRCTATVCNRMVDGKPIAWDEETNKR